MSLVLGYGGKRWLAEEKNHDRKERCYLHFNESVVPGLCEDRLC